MKVVKQSRIELVIDKLLDNFITEDHCVFCYVSWCYDKMFNKNKLERVPFGSEVRLCHSLT